MLALKSGDLPSYSSAKSGDFGQRVIFFVFTLFFLVCARNLVRYFKFLTLKSIFGRFQSIQLDKSNLGETKGFRF